VIVLGSAVSLAYYLRVVAAIWTRPDAEPRPITPGGQPVMAGGATAQLPSGDGAPRGEGHPLALAVAAVCLVAIVFFGVYPQPLFDAAQDAGAALRSIL
jgi:NADH-quinone oxidoreductase subunit N